MTPARKTSKGFEIAIEKLVYRGAGIGRHQGKVVFVPFSVPGDHLLVRPIEEKKTFIRAEMVRILKRGNGRITPLCPHFGVCGGCHWQQLEYSFQLEAKKKILEEILHHRFQQTSDLYANMQACTHPFGYRSRARLQTRCIGPQAAVGFFRRGSHRIVDIEFCPLFRPSLNEALNSLRLYKLKVDTCAQLQEMDIACSEEEGTWATALTGKSAREEPILQRTVGQFRYSVTASVFFQANDFMVSELVALVCECARNSGNDSALDLFSGVGLFSLPLAGLFENVTAVENSPSAARLCSLNARSSGFSNIQTVWADVSSWMESRETLAQGEYDLVVLNPPRTGAGPGIMDRIRKWAPKTILYVSCDPQTLARDLAGISPHYYAIDSVSAFDMFPQTYHFETLVRLLRT